MGGSASVPPEPPQRGSPLTALSASMLHRYRNSVYGPKQGNVLPIIQIRCRMPQADSRPGPRRGSRPRSRSGRRAQETMPRIVRVNVESGDRITPVVARSDGALVRACAGTGSIDRGGDGAVGSAQETVINTVGIHVLSRDRSRCVNVLGHGTLPGPCACARNVNLCEGSVWVNTQETVIHIVRINVFTYDRSCIVNAGTLRPLVRTGACARSVDDRDSAIDSAQVTMIDIVRVNKNSRDIPIGIEIIDEIYCRTLAGVGARARGVEPDDGASRFAHKPVKHVARVDPIPCNLASRVDV